MSKSVNRSSHDWNSKILWPHTCIGIQQRAPSPCTPCLSATDDLELLISLLPPPTSLALGSSVNHYTRLMGCCGLNPGFGPRRPSILPMRLQLQPFSLTSFTGGEICCLWLCERVTITNFSSWLPLCICWCVTAVEKTENSRQVAERRPQIHRHFQMS